MLQRLGIRGKILAVVAVPILVLVIAAGAITFSAARSLDGANNVKQLLEVVREGHDLADSLQAERALAANYVHTYQTESILQERAAALVDDSLRNALTAAENADGTSAAELKTAAAEILAITGLQTVRSDGGVVDIAPQPDNPPAGTLYELRSHIVVDVTDADWAEWPSDEQVSTYTTQYARFRTEIAAVHEGLPPNSEFVREVGVALRAMGDEASAFVAALTVPPTYEASLENTYEAVDGDIATFFSNADKISTRESNAGVVELVAALRSGLDDLDATRAQVYRLNTSPRVIQDYYGRSILDLNAISDQVGLGVDDLALVQELRAVGALDALIEQLQVERLVNERVIRQEFFYPGELDAMRRQVVVTDIALASARSAASPFLGDGSFPFFGAPIADPLQRTESNSFVLVRNELQLGSDVAIEGQDVRLWPVLVNSEIAQFAPIRADIWRSALARSTTIQGQRLSAAVFTALLAAAVVAASLFVALLIARRIVGPLRRLTTTATAVRQELPRLVERVALPGQTIDVSEVQIPVESSDEIGRLAEAFNAVNAATLSIAGEQAALRGSISEMFVNVARRDQVLLNRQLASIDEMERTQDDAETLQKLFALDHLATRMRRNSESLLVLAGIDTGRRMRRAMPLSDVVRTASSEIELYERIQLELDADPSMVGHSALTAAHLFAELLENATVFSDPGSPVAVKTSRRDDNFVVEIIDAGIGMAPEELREANDRVLSTAASEILGAQRLGLFVVGRIARRIGARVELESKENEGTTARVIMPVSLFDAASAGDDSHVSGSTVDEAMHVPSALLTHDQANEETDGLFDGPAAPAADEIPDESTPLPLDPPSEAPESAPAPIGWDGSTAAYESAVADDAPGAPQESPHGLPARTQEPTPAPMAAQEPTESGPHDSQPISWGLGSRAPEEDFDNTPIEVPDVPSEAEVSTADINQLIEADAAHAPVAEEVDLGALTGGRTNSGLPSRRRDSADGPEARTETTSVLGLPPRPSTGQIDELSASAQTGFVPMVSASEVAPQTAEQRASMFRGFQNTRTEDAEDVGGGAREPFGFADPPDAGAPDAIPAFEDEDSEDR